MTPSVWVMTVFPFEMTKAPSFGTIAGFNANAALPHYQATEEAFSFIDGDGLLLIDTGGQYLSGTNAGSHFFNNLVIDWIKQFLSPSFLVLYIMLHIL